jgi:hypothetical protein
MREPARARAQKLTNLTVPSPGGPRAHTRIHSVTNTGARSGHNHILTGTLPPPPQDPLGGRLSYRLPSSKHRSKIWAQPLTYPAAASPLGSPQDPLGGRLSYRLPSSKPHLHIEHISPHKPHLHIEHICPHPHGLSGPFTSRHEWETRRNQQAHRTETPIHT